MGIIQDGGLRVKGNPGGRRVTRIDDIGGAGRNGEGKKEELALLREGLLGVRGRTVRWGAIFLLVTFEGEKLLGRYKGKYFSLRAGQCCR